MNSSMGTEWWRPDLAAGLRDDRVVMEPAGSRIEDSGVPFFALMAFTVILVIAPQNFFPVLAPLRPALLTAVLASIAFIVDRTVRGQPVTILTREIWITAWLVFWAIETLPFSYWVGGSVSILVDLYFKALAVFWLVSNVVNTSKRLRRIAWGLSLMAIPLALAAVIHSVSGVFVQNQGVRRIIGYGTSLAGNPNDLALILNMVLPLSVALFVSQQRPRDRAVLLFAMTLTVAAIILTFSRAGFITLAAIFIMCLWKLLKRVGRRRAFLVLLIFLLSVPFLPGHYSERLATIVNIASDPTGSAQERWNDTLAALRYVEHHPIIGAGAGNDILALNEERGPKWKAVHNVYLQYAVDLGIPGLVLFVLLLIGCIRSAGFVQRESRSVGALRELFCLASGIQISLTAFAVAAVFYPAAFHFYFYYFAGLALAVRVIYDAEAPGSHS